MAKELKAASRDRFVCFSDRPNYNEIQTGAILRIADATEAMAREYDRLLRDKVYWKDRAEAQRLAKERALRSNAALRAWITRLRLKLKA